MVYDIPGDFSAIGLGVEVRNLHVRSCVHHFKCFSNMEFMDISDQDVERSSLESDSILQDYFNCCLVFLI